MNGSSPSWLSAPSVVSVRWGMRSAFSILGEDRVRTILRIFLVDFLLFDSNFVSGERRGVEGAERLV